MGKPIEKIARIVQGACIVALLLSIAVLLIVVVVGSWILGPIPFAVTCAVFLVVGGLVWSDAILDGGASHD